MKKVWKNYTNDTDMVQTITDGNHNPVTIEIGETKSIMIVAGTSTPAEDRAHKALVKRLAAKK